MFYKALGIMNNLSLESVLTSSASFLNYPSSEKIYDTNVNVLQAINGISKYHVFLRSLLYVPSAIYAVISAGFVGLSIVIAIVGIIPFQLTKRGNSILDYLLEESKTHNVLGYSSVDIFFLTPIITYIIGLFAMLLIGVPTLFGIADYFDYPGYIKGLKINLYTFGAVVGGFFNSNIFEMILIFISACILLQCAIFSLAYDLSGIILTFIPYHCFLLANRLIDISLEMSKLCKNEKNFLMMVFYPPAIYLLLTISAIVLIVPVLFILQLIA